MIRLYEPARVAVGSRRGPGTCRPVAIVAGKVDPSVPVERARQLIAAVEAHGGHPTAWILPSLGSVGALGGETVEHERRLVAFFDGSLGGTGGALPG